MQEKDKGLRKQERNGSKIFQCLYQKMQSKPANTSAKHKSAGLIRTLPVCWAHEYLSHRKKEKEINPLRPKSNQTVAAVNCAQGLRGLHWDGIVKGHTRGEQKGSYCWKPPDTHLSPQHHKEVSCLADIFWNLCSSVLAWAVCFPSV